jgi:flavin reductase (DIM6/NTAB) family NADH-FMN oxidoreductase RutF
MYIDFAGLEPSQVYFTMIQTVIPRPIAWVLSENAQGRFNLAPFSYFNAVCSDPPLIMISVGRKPDGRFKDTRVNIETRADFVVHLVDRILLEAMNRSSATLDEDESEVEQLALGTVPLAGSRLPRLADAKVAFACRRYQIQEIGDLPQSLILGRVAGVWVADEVAGRDDRGRLKVHADRLDPIGRLGAGEYVTFGEIRRLRRPA